MASGGIRSLVSRVEALELERFGEGDWSPKAILREWIVIVMAGLLSNTFGYNYDRQIVRAFLTTGAFTLWVYEVLTTWPDDDLRFLAILDNREDLIGVLNKFLTKSETLPVKRLGTGLLRMTQFQDLRAKAGKLPVYVFPDFPLPDPSAVLAEVQDYWRRVQKPEPEPTLEDIIDYMQDKFGKVFQGGPGHRSEDDAGQRYDRLPAAY